MWKIEPERKIALVHGFRILNGPIALEAKAVRGKRYTVTAVRHDGLENFVPLSAFVDRQLSLGEFFDKLDELFAAADTAALIAR